MSKKNIILIALVVVLVIVLGITAYLNKRNNQAASTAQQQTKAELVKKDISPEQLPDKFPTDIPIEKNAPIVQNFNATNDSLFQATRAFISKESVDKNIALYKQYLEKNGYTITPLEHDNFKSLMGKRDGNTLQVSVDYNQLAKFVTVTINYTEKLKK
jgi:Tfp pilus assembly protein PilV